MSGSGVDGRHNARDGRCRYTLGADRCPAVGSVRVGDWWVCESHRYWAEGPGDPDRAEDGKAALESEQYRARMLEGKREAESSAARELAMREIRGILPEVGRASGPVAGFERWRVMAIEAYRERRAELERCGVARQAAHEQALADVGERIARLAVGR